MKTCLYTSEITKETQELHRELLSCTVFSPVFLINWQGLSFNEQMTPALKMIEVVNQYLKVFSTRIERM